MELDTDKEEKKTTLSEKIEDAFLGVLRFLRKYIYTHWIMLRHPLSGSDKLLKNINDPTVFSRPVTFLAIGGFIFTLIFSAFPYGGAELLNIIWFDSEISEKLHDRWSEALTITGLITAAFPVLIAVVSISTMYGYNIFPESKRSEFVSLNSYYFGLFSFFIFSLFIIPTVASLFSHLGFKPSEKDETILLYAFWGLILFLTVMSIVLPVIGITRFHWKNIESNRYVVSLLTIFSPVYVLFLMFILSYVASVPEALKELAKPKEPEIIIHTISGPKITLDANSKVASEAQIVYSVVLENQTTSPLVENVSGLRVYLHLLDGKKVVTSYQLIHERAYNSGGIPRDAIFVKGESAEEYLFQESVLLPIQFRENILNKIDDPVNNNHLSLELEFEINTPVGEVSQDFYVQLDSVSP